MYYIVDYIDNVFTLNFSEKLDREVFEVESDYLTSLHIHYSSKHNTRIIDCERIDEITLLFDKHLKEYKLTQSAVDQLVAIQQTLYSKETKFFRNRTLDFSILNKNVTPFNFQVEDINWSLRRSNYLDANDTGLGKTFVNIVVSSQNYKENFIDGIIIFCKNHMTYHWKYEILEKVNLFKEEDILIIKNENKIKPFEQNIDKKIIIIPNNTVVFTDTIVSYKKNPKTVRWSSYSLDIKKLWNKKSIMCIGDESHVWKHSSTERSRALKCIKDNFDFRALLSATPNINHFEDIYPQITFVDKSLIPYSENAFKMKITEESGKYGRYSIKTYNTQAILDFKKTWVNHFRQRLKQDCPEMKAKIFYNPIYLELSKEQSYMYQTVVSSVVNELEEEHDNITVEMLAGENKNSKSYLINEVFSDPFRLTKRNYSDNELVSILKEWTIEKDPKFIALSEMLEERIEERDEKVVVYDSSPYTLDRLYKKFKKYNPVIIHGSLKDIKDRQLDRREKETTFNNDPKCKLALLSSLTSSDGLNLQKNCHQIIVYNMPESGEDFVQLTNRTHRIISVSDTQIYVLFYPDTFENVKVQRNMNRKDFNESMSKQLTEKELHMLLNGKVDKF